MKDRSPGQILVEPTTIRIGDDIIQLSLHEPSWRFKQELDRVFPSRGADILVVPTFQKCRSDMVGIGAEIEHEKDERLLKFVAVASKLEKDLVHKHWVDHCDPASGYPAISERGPSPYPDVQGAQALLKYQTSNTGCCAVLLHPQWGSNLYPATIFIERAAEQAFKDWIAVQVADANAGKDVFDFAQYTSNSTKPIKADLATATADLPVQPTCASLVQILLAASPRLSL